MRSTLKDERRLARFRPSSLERLPFLDDGGDVLLQFSGRGMLWQRVQDGDDDEFKALLRVLGKGLAGEVEDGFRLTPPELGGVDFALFYKLKEANGFFAKEMLVLF